MITLNIYNATKLARKVVYTLSDGYDDRENEEKAIDDLYNSLKEIPENSIIGTVLNLLCDRIEELE